MFVKDIRQQLQNQLGSSIYKLVEKVLDCEITITENGRNVKLKKLTLTHLPYEKCQIWRINLESRIPGLSTANKTGEIALYSTRSQTKLYCHFDDRRNLIIATKDFSYRRNDKSPNCERVKYSHSEKQIFKCISD